MCPECGASRGEAQLGDENEDGQYIRQRRCRNCGLRYPTVEVAVSGTTFWLLAGEARQKMTERQRRLRGYRASLIGSYYRQRDRLEVEVRVVKGRRQKGRAA